MEYFHYMYAYNKDWDETYYKPVDAILMGLKHVVSGQLALWLKRHEAE